MTTKKIALFRSPHTGGLITHEEGCERYLAGYVRVSAYIDVSFPPVSSEELAAIFARLDESHANERKRLMKHRRDVLEALRGHPDNVVPLIRTQAE